MALAEGTRFAHYEIVSAIGKGGMGEVWKAKDTKLGREVAIKTLPEEFAKDADRLARFEREAKLLASLNHPNIAAIYGLEEHNGIRFLVLELVEGPTLENRIKQGAIPVEESLKLALQIAEALEAAHEKGVIHRDLKPANIKVTADGKVKVLDFGLAKAFAGDQADVSLSNSPTLSMAATQQGIILGTAAYMSPEQAKGRAVEKRADIWAFGAVLYEMITGRQSFGASDVSEALAAVIRAEPNWSALPGNLHPRLNEVLERCLEKDLNKRFRDIGDVKVDIEKVLADPSGVLTRSVTEVVPATPQSKLPWAFAVLGIIVAGIAVWTLKPVLPTEPRPVIRSEYDLPAGQQLRETDGATFALSPDGSSFVYNTVDGLYLRSMDELEARLIPGTEEGSRSPFFSPDGQWVGFHRGSQLEKIAISGGAPVGLTPANLNLFGVNWGVDDMILFGQGEGIFRVSASGGTPELIIESEPGEILDAPQLLRDEWILFTAGFPGTWDNAQIVVQSLESGERKALWTGSDARYVPTGHLVYALDDDLFAVPFDLDTLEVTGGAVPLVEGVVRAAVTASANYGISEDGSLMYLTGGSAFGLSTLVWLDRQGNKEPFGPAHAWGGGDPRLSPDGQRVAVPSGGDIWVLDIPRETLTRLTFDGGSLPLWTPDGQHVTYRAQHQEDTNLNLYWTKADGSGTEEQLTMGDFRQNPSSWSPDGQLLAFFQSPGVGGDLDRDIWIMPLDGDREPWPFLATRFNEGGPKFSPDGNWLAYVSDESGQNEVYVLPFPGPGGKRQVSTEGGGDHLWSRDGREIFYLNGNKMMVVEIETEPDFRAGTPRLLFEVPFQQNSLGRLAPYDVTTDGQRFVMVQQVAFIDGEIEPPQIITVLNWFEELKERVPVP